MCIVLRAIAIAATAVCKPMADRGAVGSAGVAVMQDVVADKDAATVEMRYVGASIAESESEQRWRQADGEVGQCPICWLVVRRAL